MILGITLITSFSIIAFLIAMYFNFKELTQKVSITNNNQSKFEETLRRIINSQSKKNTSNTSDFILAQYLNSCLDAYDVAVQQRKAWYDKDPRSSAIVPRDPI